MLKNLFKPLVEMLPEERIEFFQEYWKRRALDMLKQPTWEANKEKKAKTKKAKAKKATTIRKKKEKLISVKDIPAEVLELLKKAGMEI
jgi:hypothetical protein